MKEPRKQHNCRYGVRVCVCLTLERQAARSANSATHRQAVGFFRVTSPFYPPSRSARGRGAARGVECGIGGVMKAYTCFFSSTRMDVAPLSSSPSHPPRSAKLKATPPVSLLGHRDSTAVKSGPSSHFPPRHKPSLLPRTRSNYMPPFCTSGAACRRYYQSRLPVCRVCPEMDRTFLPFPLLFY